MSQEKIKIFIEKELLKSARPILADENILESGILDSMGIVQIITFLEREFGIKVEEDDFNLNNFSNIKNIAEFVNRKKVQK